MVNVGFLCLRSILCALNVVYMMLGVLLMGLAVWSRGFTLVVSVNIISGVLMVAVVLLLVSILGFVGTLKHHQILLFCYMVLLSFVFLFQFGVSCSCFAFNREQQERVLGRSWAGMSSDGRRSLEQRLDCCGLNNRTQNREFNLDASLCTAACKVRGRCFQCGDLILQHGGETLKILGGIGLFFSFSLILAVWLVLQYRNQKDPQFSSSAPSQIPLRTGPAGHSLTEE
ncbi:tetraspanin-31-A [Astyanax mexicanus]|uniref:Tetraspanin-31-A n=1 Tax=Astyanax mexicanus TaxID=7994 RepID=A0A8B9HXH1_ASTMX|nr:tetraspanin-31-A [Astyanax mexicanus]